MRWLLPIAVLLAGCSGQHDPLVDRLNVSDAKYHADIDACKQSSSGFSLFGDPLAKCMRGKGYRVLMD